MLMGQKCSSDKIGLAFDKTASNIASYSKTMFVKLEIAEPQNNYMYKGKGIVVCENANKIYSKPVKKHSNKRSMPTYHQCGISDHIRPHCPQIHSQKHKVKKQEPKKTKLDTKAPNANHAYRHQRQHPQRFVLTWHQCGKTGHSKSRCFKSKPREPKITISMSG